MDMRTAHCRHAKDRRIARDEGCGQSGIRYTSNPLVPYRQYKLASNEVGSKVDNTTAGRLGMKRMRKNTSLSSISRPFCTFIQYLPRALEVEERHLPNPTNHAHLESASNMLSPTILHAPIFHSRTSSVASQPSAWTATAITAPTSPIANGTSNALHAPSCSTNALIMRSFSMPPLTGVSRE